MVQMNGTAVKETYAAELINVINRMESDLDAYKESLEIIADEGLMNQLKKSEEDVKAGRIGRLKSKQDIDKLFE